MGSFSSGVSGPPTEVVRPVSLQFVSKGVAQLYEGGAIAIQKPELGKIRAAVELAANGAIPVIVEGVRNEWP